MFFPVIGFVSTGVSTGRAWRLAHGLRVRRGGPFLCPPVPRRVRSRDQGTEPLLAHVYSLAPRFCRQVVDFAQSRGEFVQKCRDRYLVNFLQLLLRISGYYASMGRDRCWRRPCSCAWSAPPAAKASSTNTCAWSKPFVRKARRAIASSSISDAVTCLRHISTSTS